MSTELVELPNTPGKDTQNAELCLSCLNMFRAGENGGAVFEYVLFNHDTIHELLPKTCSVCAIIDFEAFSCQEEVSKVACVFSKAPRGNEYCQLRISLNHRTEYHDLYIVRADSELFVSIAYIN